MVAETMSRVQTVLVSDTETSGDMISDQRLLLLNSDLIWWYYVMWLILTLSPEHFNIHQKYFNHRATETRRQHPSHDHCSSDQSRPGPSSVSRLQLSASQKIMKTFIWRRGCWAGLGRGQEGLLSHQSCVSYPQLTLLSSAQLMWSRGNYNNQENTDNTISQYLLF